MMQINQSTGIFGGTDAVIASFLRLGENQYLKQRSLSRRLRDIGNSDRDYTDLLSDLYGCIETNYVGRQPSIENWRSKRVTTLSNHNKSPEVLLERSVAMLGEAGILPGWFNQVPVASGLVDSRSDKRAAIDLVELHDDTTRFVELKWESDTPAFAAFEILRYGLVYLFSRVNAAKFDCTDCRLMRVDHVKLQAVAPTVFFEEHDLRWLERGLNLAIGDLSSKKTWGRLAMSFEFLALPANFKLPFKNGAEVRAACEANGLTERALKIRDALTRVSPVWHDANS